MSFDRLQFSTPMMVMMDTEVLILVLMIFSAQWQTGIPAGIPSDISHFIESISTRTRIRTAASYVSSADGRRCQSCSSLRLNVAFRVGDLGYIITLPPIYL